MKRFTAGLLARILSVLVACGGCALFSPLATGADWAPSEKITVVTHATPGASIDVLVRTFADAWNKNKIAQQQAAVENITGTGGDKARRHVSQQNKGNSHMLFGYTPQMMIAPIRTRSDINVRSFTPIALVAVEPTVLFVNAETPYRSVKDLIEAARQKPKGILQGGGQFGGPPSLMGRMMADEAKVEFAYTPFKTSAESVIALLGKHVTFIMEQMSEAEQHVKAGKLRALATSIPLENYPALPTFESAGTKFRTLKQFRGIVAPPGLPPEVAEYYIGAVKRVQATPEWRRYVKQFELIEQAVFGKQFADWLQEEEQVYRRLSTELGLLKN